jgi:hypothetical protein
MCTSLMWATDRYSTEPPTLTPVLPGADVAPGQVPESPYTATHVHQTCCTTLECGLIHVAGEGARLPLQLCGSTHMCMHRMHAPHTCMLRTWCTAPHYSIKVSRMHTHTHSKRRRSPHTSYTLPPPPTHSFAPGGVESEFVAFRRFQVCMPVNHAAPL